MTYKELEELSQKWNGKVCIFGAGAVGNTWGYDIIKLTGFHVDFYYDNKKSPGIEIIDGIKTTDFITLSEQKDNVLVFVTVVEKYHDEIVHQLEHVGITNYILIGNMLLQDFCESVLNSKDEKTIEKYKVIVDDAEYLKKLFHYKTGYELNLESPKTFNEKLQWLKLYDRNPAYTKLVDKYELKKYIQDVLGEEYVIPTFGVWNSVEEIEWDKLPEQFVLKCTHDSGSVIICHDVKKLDMNSTKEKLNMALKRNFYWGGREWPYKNVKPRIIAEELLNKDKEDIKDYKFFLFNGCVKAMYIVSDRNNSLEETKFDFFNRDFNHLNFMNAHPNACVQPEKPYNYNLMIEIAEKLASKMRHVRVDFYEVNGHIYLGEFTYYHMCGLASFKPFEWDEIFGKWIDLSHLGRHVCAEL